MLGTAPHWRKMISAQTLALKMKMRLYVVQMEMLTGKAISMKFSSYSHQAMI
jgi:hypothetical protein